MSAFAVIYERTNTMGNPAVFNRVMERLNHRGPDGSNIVSANNVTMGHWHFWTTPEEVGERQPLALDGLPFKIVLDGRIDNREELFAQLNISSVEGEALSDAALILRAYAQWDKECFKNFIGEFALVLFDEQKNELICARDQLGSRTLFHASQGSQIIIASEPWAVASIYGEFADINENGVAHYFALKAPEDGQTLFKNIYELLPAQVMTVSASSQSTQRYWTPDLSKKTRFKTDEEYAEHFQLLMKESIRCRLRSTTPTGVLMSGGLDSTTIACLAASMVSPQTLTTISCVFDELPECDERPYINAVTNRYAMRSIQIPCDDAWPLRDWQNWLFDPNYPTANPYFLVRERAYQRAQQEGMRVLLTGDFGDHLYTGSDDWLADLLAEGRVFLAAQELFYYLRVRGVRRTLRASFLRRVARRLLDGLGGKNLHRKSTPAPWLTSKSIDVLSLQDKPNEALSERQNTLLGASTAKNSSMGYSILSRYTLELRHPCRDFRLVNFMLTLPARQIYRHGLFRHILRQAMREILPELIYARPNKTHWLALFFRGIERERRVLQSYMENSQALWRQFIRPNWITNRWDSVFTAEQDGIDKLIPWQCVSYETWHRRHLPS